MCTLRHQQGQTIPRHHRQPHRHARRHFVVRHSESGAPYLIAQRTAPQVHVSSMPVTDGTSLHPTQGLLDAPSATLQEDFTD